MSEERVIRGWTKSEIMDGMIDRPPHYTVGGMDVIDFIEAKQLGYHLGNVVKYISRAGIKSENPITDLKKAKWYLERHIEMIEKGRV